MSNGNNSALCAGDVVYVDGSGVMLKSRELKVEDIPDMELKELYAAQSELRELMTDTTHVDLEAFGVVLSVVNAELMKRGTVIHFGETIDNENEQ